MTEGLRERKKQQTRQAIHVAAMRLFAERGFEATTIADIAAAADISPRTFFAYFPSKEEVVFAKFEPAFEDFDRTMTERPPGTTALEALREWIARAAKQFTGDADAARLEARLRRESPPWRPATSSTCACSSSASPRPSARISASLPTPCGRGSSPPPRSPR